MATLKTSNIIYFFGNLGVFSASVFTQLTEQGIVISKVFCAGIAPASTPLQSLPVMHTPVEMRLDTLARDQGIPVEYISNKMSLNSIRTNSIQRPDYNLVACFPYKLPSAIIDWPLSSCLNIHPSLLPKYRGPDPIFWQLYNNEPATGVTLHLVSTDIDAGPIISQKATAYIEGAKRDQIEISLSQVGAKLFTEFVSTNSDQGMDSIPQNESKSSYNPFPAPDNYEISTNWTAKQAFNFINATCPPNGDYLIRSQDNIYQIKSVSGYFDDKHSVPIPLDTANELLIQFSPGFLQVKIS